MIADIICILLLSTVQKLRFWIESSIWIAVLDLKSIFSLVQIKEEEEREKNDGKEVNEKFTKKMSYDDQIRQLHEAYQFLIKRYKLQESIANVSLIVQSLEKQQKRMEKTAAIQSENIKKEEMENVGKSAKKVDDADKQELKRKPPSSLKRTKKTPKNN